MKFGMPKEMSLFNNTGRFIEAFYSQSMY